MSMDTRTPSLAEEAERLPPADRIRLVQHLLATLEKPDAGIDRAWFEECQRRLDSYLRGETTASDAEEVLSRHLKR
jgi:putative addiction module component (TIGR02574 family)